MPEGLEAEIYRRAAERVIGRRISDVDVDDRQPMAEALRAALPGAHVSGVERHGKLVVLALKGARGATALGLHFGMTGRLIVDHSAAIDQLVYGGRRDEPAWDRLRLRFVGVAASSLRVNDPRRWALFSLDPDLARLGPDFLTIDAEQLAEAFARRRVAVKAVLLDQSAVAGFGNLCVDEILWQADVAPHRPARELRPIEVERIVAASRQHLPAMLARGGSHTGVISPAVRATAAPCPRDREPLVRTEVGGRTTVWCPAHQR